MKHNNIDNSTLTEVFKQRFINIKKVIKGSYLIVIFVTMIIISKNYKLLVEFIKKNRINYSSFLALTLTISLFLLIVIPIMTHYTRKKCHHCHEIVLRNAINCHKCGCNLKNDS